MATYERVNERGQVVERVYAPDGTFEDTRLGVAALEGTGWAVVGDAADEPRFEAETAGDRPPARRKK